MDNLVSLSDLITRQKIYQADVIDQLDGSQNKMSQLYNAILEGQVKDDFDAYDLLYEGSENKEALYKLKNRLYDRLLNSVFFLDVSVSKYKDTFEAAKACYKNYALVKLLYGNRKMALAIELAEKTIQKSMKFEFTDINYLLSSILTHHYLIRKYNKSKFKKYSELQDYFLKAMSGEIEVERAYGHLGIVLSQSSAGLKKEEINEYLQQIESIRERQQHIMTLKFNLYAIMFQSFVYFELKEYAKIIELVEEGIELFKKRGVSSGQADYTLNARAALAHFLLKNYDKAEYYYLENLSVVGPSNQNWYTIYNQYFSLKIIQGKYNDAYDILAKVFVTKQFEKTHPLLIQLFKIKEAYMHFLVTLGKVDPSKSQEEPLRKFRLNRFLNDVPTYAKDKRGVNISILIIQMILLVQNKKYNQVLDKLDALNMYSHRYLRGDHTFRSNCFIKMLAKLPDAGYHPVRWERYVTKFRKRLDEYPYELSYNNLDLEVLPFETMYDLVLEMLQTNKK